MSLLDPHQTNINRTANGESADGTRNFYIGPHDQFGTAGSGVIQNAHTTAKECFYSYQGYTTTLEFPFDHEDGSKSRVFLTSHRDSEMKNDLEGWKKDTLRNGDARCETEDEEFRKECNRTFGGKSNTKGVSELGTRMNYAWEFLMEPHLDHHGRGKGKASEPRSKWCPWLSSLGF